MLIPTKSEKALAMVPIAKYRKTNTPISVIGKMNENKFKVGADLVIIPPARFILSLIHI